MICGLLFVLLATEEAAAHSPVLGAAFVVALVATIMGPPPRGPRRRWGW